MLIASLPNMAFPRFIVCIITHSFALETKKHRQSVQSHDDGFILLCIFPFYFIHDGIRVTEVIFFSCLPDCRVVIGRPLY